MCALFGLWRLGAVPVVVPHSTRGGIPAWAEMAASRAHSVEAKLMLVDAELAAALAAVTAGPVASLAEVAAVRPGRGPVNLAMPAPDDLGLLQFTSATTGTSKAVRVAQGQIVGNIHA